MRCQRRTDTTFASPILHYRERELVDRLHREKLRDAKATVNTKPPEPQPHLQLYGRDYYARKKATIEAAYRDLKLCQRLVEESERKPVPRDRKGPLSLNARTRAKEVERIMKENHKLLDNLDKIQSAMKTQDVLDHDRERQRYVILGSHTKRLAGEYDGELLHMWETDITAAEARRMDIEARQQRLMSSVNGSLLRKRPTTAPSHIQCRPVLCCPRTSLTTSKDIRKHCRPSSSAPALALAPALARCSESPSSHGGGTASLQPQLQQQQQQQQQQQAVTKDDGKKLRQQPGAPRQDGKVNRRSPLLQRPRSAPSLGTRKVRVAPPGSGDAAAAASAAVAAANVAANANAAAAGIPLTESPSSLTSSAVPTRGGSSGGGGGGGGGLSLQSPAPAQSHHSAAAAAGRPGRGGLPAAQKGHRAAAASGAYALSVVGSCAKPGFDIVEAEVAPTTTLDEDDDEVNKEEEEEEEEEDEEVELQQTVVATGWLL